MHRAQMPRTIALSLALSALAAPARAQYPQGDDIQSLSQGTTSLAEELERLPRTEVQSDLILLDARGFAEVHDSESEFLGGRETEHINPEIWQDIDGPRTDLDDDDD